MPRSECIYLSLFIHLELDVVLMYACVVVKGRVQIHDALDLFGEHAIDGIIRLLFNRFFGDSSIVTLDVVNTSHRSGSIGTRRER